MTFNLEKAAMKPAAEAKDSGSLMCFADAYHEGAQALVPRLDQFPGEVASEQAAKDCLPAFALFCSDATKGRIGGNLDQINKAFESPFSETTTATVDEYWKSFLRGDASTVTANGNSKTRRV